MNMNNVYETMSNYKIELTDLLNEGTVKDPALYWAGKMSQLTHAIYHMHLGSPDLSETLAVLHKVSGEYDKIIVSRTQS